MYSDEEDSDKEEDKDVSEEEEMRNLLQEENVIDDSGDESDENYDKVLEHNSIVQIPLPETNMGHGDPKLNSLLHSTVDGWESTSSSKT